MNRLPITQTSGLVQRWGAYPSPKRQRGVAPCVIGAGDSRPVACAPGSNHGAVGGPRAVVGVALVLAIASVVFFAGSASAQTGGGYDLTWNTIDGGGETFSTGGDYKLGATIGQHDAGTMSGAGYALRGGFLPSSAAACLLHDMNYDGFPSIIGDVPSFVDCVFFGNCNCPQPGCICPGDCNCDGFLSIIGDVPCFVDCVFFGNCTECSGRSGSPGEGDGFTIGGAVYEDEANPLTTGLEGITVNILDTERRTVASTTTAPTMGLWRIDDLPEGSYTVVFAGGGGEIPRWRDAIKIIVSKDNKAANQSIRVFHDRGVSKPSPR